MSPLYEWFASTFQVLTALPWLLTWPEYGEEYFEEEGFEYEEDDY